MRYFLRTDRYANLLIAAGTIFLLTAVIILFLGGVGEQVFLFGNANYVKGGVFFAIWFLLSAVCFVAAAALKCVVRDATEELEAMRLDSSSSSVSR